MNSRTAVTLLLLLHSLVGFSQQDTTYVRKFPEKVTVRVGVQNTSNSFVFTDTETNETTSLFPNDKTYLGISFLFRSIELDFGYAPNFFSENQDNKGSKLFTLNFRMFMGKWMQTLDFYKQKGFFLGNLEQTNFLSFPDARTLKIGGTTSYIFNNRFSFRAIGFQNEWQKKSAGSFIPSLSTYYTKFNLASTGLATGNQAISLALGPGYYYNWVVKKRIILAAGITTGFGINFTKSPENNNSAFLFQTMLRTAIGYNSEHFFTGINVSFQFVEYDANPNTILQDDITFAEFYLGYRFKAPKNWVDKAAKVNRKFGLN